MKILEPWQLLWLLPVVVLVGGYVLLQARRKKYAVRFTQLEMLKSVAPNRPGWRRHVPVALVLLALVFLTVGMARPAHETEVAEEAKIVMVNIDVSRSMEATDVAPSRLAAAQAAATDFVRELPEGIQVGLVSFSNSARVLVPPTDSRGQVERAISRLQPEQSTASGDAIIASLGAIDAALGESADGQPRSTEDSPAAIVLLSDGDRQQGVSLDVAAEAAREQNVPVSTITFGTPSGSVVVDGTLVPVPPDPAAMAEVAEATGGQAFDAQNADELRDVYSQIQGEVAFSIELSDLWPWFVGTAFVLLLVGIGGSFYWTGRFL